MIGLRALRVLRDLRAGLRSFVVLTTATVCLAAQQQPPTFKSGIEIFHLDVSVLDRQRQPVRGLTAADFTVLEDGQPQKIVAFSAVDVPDAIAPPAPWMRDVAPDVTTNQFRERRLFVIVMDDATIPFDLRAVKNAKAIGRDVVEQMGPSDLAAVVFTRDNRRPQDFTADRARLLAAIDRTTGGNRPAEDSSENFLKYSPYYLSAIDTLWEAARLLIEIPERRKVLVYISGGVPLDVEEAATLKLAAVGGSMADYEVARHAAARTQEIFTQATRANVNVYAFDACGMRVPAGTKPRPCERPSIGTDLNIEFLQSVAGPTGGHATVNTSDFRPGVAQMFRENSSYYLLGYEATASRGTEQIRRLDVRVNREGADVRSRTRRFTELPETEKRGAPVSAATKALAGLLPKGDIPLVAQLAPFAIPGRRDLAAVAVTMALRQPRDAFPPDATSADMNWEVRAFDPEGRARGSLNQRAGVRIRQGETGIHYELITRMDLRPGPYQFRLAVNDVGGARSGSVYVDVDVPDYADAPVSLSGVVLSSSSSPIAAPRDGLPALLPLVPTTGRAFTRDDRVTTFVRVYQGGDARRPAAPVTFVTRITGTDATPVVNASQVLDPTRFSARAADVRYELPLSSLEPAPYLLTLEATLGKTTARRDVRFEIK
jgi:VWFA-related protein